MGVVSMSGKEWKYFENDRIYDLESYPNIFTFCIIDASGENLEVYEISDRKNQLDQILVCLRKLLKNKSRMVGYNNTGYDYTLLHEIITIAREAKIKGITAVVTARMMYKLTSKIIDSMKDEKFAINIRESDHAIKQVDLYKIWHFDNKARATSLKMLEFNMRSDSIEDLPFPVGTSLTDAEKDILITYNKKDVLETLKFYYRSYEALELRDELSALYGFDCTNFNDTKIGKELFIRTLETEKPGSCYEITKRGRKIKQTRRSEIVIKDCLFSIIKFNRPEFKAVHNWFKQQVITETKGVFSDLLEHTIGDVAKYAQLTVKKKKLNDLDDPKNKRYVPSEQRIADLKKEYPLGWIEEKPLKSPKGAISYYWCWNIVDTMNVVINGFRFDYGVGGIHGATQGTHISTDDRKIRTLDVASYYPNMAISNEVYPEHLGKAFCKVYKRLYDNRKRQPKGSGANKALKLALNGVYGETNNEYSPLYDPKYTMSITIGGQLLLCMLMEKLIDHCDAEIIMCNTDGFEYIIAPEMFDKADSIVKEWESLTKLEMEGDEYAKMFVRDVNNYLSVTESGKVKTKGAYEVLPYEELGWSKNHSSMVIAQAVYNELIDNGNAVEYIMSHKEPYDFMLRAKVPRSSKLVLVEQDEFGESESSLQNICRYYPAKKGGKLVKIMPPLLAGGEPRRLGISTEWNVIPCNRMVDFKWGVDYDYYIKEANALLEGVKTP